MYSIDEDSLLLLPILDEKEKKKKKNSLNFSLFTISNSCFPKFSTQQLSYMGGTLKNADWKCSLSVVIFTLRASSWADSQENS